MIHRKLNIAQPTFHGNEKKYVMDALESGWISSIGPYIENFEREFARYHGVKHAIATHNGTIALHLALSACGITKDDEVIVPDLTFIATANSVRYCNGTPVLADVALDDWNLEPTEIVRLITPGTRAIIPVHLYGNPAKMNEIMSIAKANHLLVVEDCAEALGSICSGKKVGTFGDIGCFSFFGNKIITTGEGGMCITNNDDLADKMRILRDHGMNKNKKYWYDVLGFNYRMTNMQAAVGLAQLEQLPELLKLRDTLYQHYRHAFSKHPQVIIQETHGERNINWIFTLRVKGMNLDQRDIVMERLKQYQIDSRPVFYPIHQMNFYQNSRTLSGDYPNSDLISNEGISLPTFIGLQENEIEYIADSLIESLKTLGL